MKLRDSVREASARQFVFGHGEVVHADGEVTRLEEGVASQAVQIELLFPRRQQRRIEAALLVAYPRHVRIRIGGDAVGAQLDHV